MSASLPLPFSVRYASSPISPTMMGDMPPRPRLPPPSVLNIRHLRFEGGGLSHSRADLNVGSRPSIGAVRLDEAPLHLRKAAFEFALGGVDGVLDRERSAALQLHFHRHHDVVAEL